MYARTLRPFDWFGGRGLWSGMDTKTNSARGGANRATNTANRRGLVVVVGCPRLIVTGPASIGVGGTAAFSASAIYPRRTESITGRATWVSSANAVARVSSSGVVRGVSEGVASITATFSGVAGSATVQVRPARKRELPRPH